MRRLAPVLAASVIVGCAKPDVAPRVVERDVTVLTRITLRGLPAHTRVLLDAPRAADRRLLANDVTGDVVLTFPHAMHESVRNGVPTRTPKPQTVALVVQARSRVPKRVNLSLAESAVTIDLGAPWLPVLPKAEGGHVDAGLEAWVAGRCGEVEKQLGAASERATDPRDVASFDKVIRSCKLAPVTAAETSDWDPANLDLDPKVFRAPEPLMASLRLAFEADNDRAGLAALRVLGPAITSGQPGLAARLSAKLAEPLSPKRAAIALALPRALYAGMWASMARSAESQGDLRRAFELAIEARAASPRIGSPALASIHPARAIALEASARAARSEVVARAYWTARAALLPGDAASTAGLAATESPAIVAQRLELAVRTSGDATGTALLLSRLRERLPRHVVIVNDPSSADVVVDALFAPVERTHKISKTTRQKSVYVGDVTRPNPEHEDAQREVASAEEGVARAQEQANQLRRQAQENNARARNSGALGPAAAFAGLSAVGEGTAAAIVSSATSRLSEARARLARTPQTITQRVERPTAYPVLVLETRATQEVLARAYGVESAPFDVRERAEASATREHVEPQPEIQVAGQAADVASLEHFAPAVEPVIDKVVDALADRIRKAEEANAWEALLPWLESDITGERAMPGLEAAVAYLMVSADPQSERAQYAIDFLVRRLP